MRVGCAGCLATLALLVVALVAAGAWTAARVLRRPDLPAWVATAAESKRAQQKLYDLVRRPARGRGRGTEAIAFSEAEVNALLSRHLRDPGGSALKGSSVRLLGAIGSTCMAACRSAPRSAPRACHR